MKEKRAAKEGDRGAKTPCGQDDRDAEYIDVYGSYALRLLKLQSELIQTFDRHRRGNRQTVEVRHVHIYPGGQGVVGIVNQKTGEEDEK